MSRDRRTSRGRHLVRELPGGYQPIDKIEGPLKPPPKPLDAERSALPPAYWKDRNKKRDN
jgi:hypothetical protein